MNNKIIQSNIKIKNCSVTPSGNIVEYLDKNFVCIKCIDNKSNIIYNKNTITLSQCITLYNMFYKEDIDTAIYFINLK